MKAVQLASKTLAAIESTIAGDQGASYRQFQQRVLPHIGDAYRGVDSPFRTHLGASVIGDECARKIWYGFHWTTVPSFGGRILRLFNRGHLEEGRFIAALLAIGCQVYQQDSNGKQFRISGVGGHFGGSGDGIVIGLPDLNDPSLPALLEFKTHNDKSFMKLKKEGVRSAKFEHYVQMQIYLRKMNLTVALYMAVNKNDDEIYAEIITLDTETSDQFIDRAGQIIALRVPPARISESPGWFACAWCDHKPVCHLKKDPHKNCRTCEFSFCNLEGGWYCEWDHSSVELTPEQQEKGCSNWARNNAI